MKQTTEEQHARRLELLQQRVGSADPGVLYKALMEWKANAFTKRSYLQSLYHLPGVTKKMKEDILEICVVLKELGYKKYDKYNDILSLDEIKKKVIDYYDADSWQLMLMLLYIEWPLRDNVPLRILSGDELNVVLSDIERENYPKYNFFYVKGNNIHCVICSTKTVPKVYAPIDRVLSNDYSRRFLKFFKENTIAFPLKENFRQHKVIAKLLRDAGVMNGSINYMRRAHRIQALNSNDMDVIRRNAQLSFHSLRTANIYNS